MTSPPQPSDPADAIGTAQTLATALEGMAGQLKTVNENSEERDAELKRYGRVNRRRIWLSYAGLAVDVVLTVVVGLFAVQAHNASTSAAETRTASIAACQSTNVARAENEQLWDYVLTLFAPRSGESAADRERGDQVLSALKAHVAVTFAPRNCERLYTVAGGSG